MFFSRHKKLQRDREAGLVFCWRGGYEGNRGGMLMAVLFAGGLFSLGFFAITIDFKPLKAEQRKFAKILLLDELSPEMALWVDQNSPFPSRWDPQQDGFHQERVVESLGLVYQELSQPPSPWREVDGGLESMALMNPLSKPHLVEHGVVELGSLPKLQAAVAEVGTIELRLALSAMGDLEKRAPLAGDGMARVSFEIPREAYGGSYRFSVIINASGHVMYCTPTDWQVNAFTSDLENWVRSQKFQKKEGAGAVLGEVVVDVGGESDVRD